MKRLSIRPLDATWPRSDRSDPDLPVDSEPTIDDSCGPGGEEGDGGTFDGLAGRQIVPVAVDPGTAAVALDRHVDQSAVTRHDGRHRVRRFVDGDAPRDLRRAVIVAVCRRGEIGQP